MQIFLPSIKPKHQRKIERRKVKLSIDKKYFQKEERESKRDSSEISQVLNEKKIPKIKTEIKNQRIPLKISQYIRRRKIDKEEKKPPPIVHIPKEDENNKLYRKLGDKIREEIEKDKKSRSIENIEKALKNLDRIVKELNTKDFLWIDLIFTLSDRITDKTAYWWNDTKFNLKIRHGKSDEDLEKLKKDMEKYFKTRWEVDLFAFINEAGEIKEKILETLKKRFWVVIEKKLLNINDEDKEILKILLKNYYSRELCLSSKDFIKIRDEYEKRFGKEYKKDIESMIIKLGLGNRFQYYYSLDITNFIKEELENFFGVKYERVEQKQKRVEEIEDEIEREYAGYDFVNLLFGKNYGALFLKEHPVCIIVSKTNVKYEDLISILCLENYLEEIGNKPEPRIIKDLEELEKIVTREHVEPEEQIIVLDEEKIIEDRKEKKLNKILIEYLRGFFSLDKGFIIITAKNPNDFAKDIMEKDVHETPPIVITLEERFENPEIVKRILKIMNLFDDDKLLEYGFIRNYQKSKDKFIRKYLYDYPYRSRYEWLLKNRSRIFKKSAEIEDYSGKMHAAMKAFTAVVLYNQHNKADDQGRIEPEIEEEEKEADIKMKDEYYEIETGIGCEDPIAKLTEKVKKYSSNSKIRFVLRNITILLHLRELLIFKETWRKEEYDIEIFGIDMKEEKLIPIDEFKKELNEIKKHLSM